METPYLETQTSSSSLKTILWIAFCTQLVFTVFIVVVALTDSQNVGLMDNMEPLFAPCVILALGSVIPMILLSGKQHIQVDSQGIHIRLRPFHIKGRFISWKDIESWKIRKISALGEFGGWGIRGWPGSIKTGYIWSGNQGLEMVLKSGKIIVVTTVNPIELGRVMASSPVAPLKCM